MTIIVWDTETTGLLAPSAAGVHYQPHLIDLYAIKLDMNLNLIDTFSIRVRPPIQIPPEASKVNGITDDMVTDCLPFAAKYNDVAEFYLGSKVQVGHGLMFDKSVLHWELMRLGKSLNFPWAIQDVDTLEICSQQLGHRLNLTDLHVWLFNEGFYLAHTANVDCQITHKCFIEMVGRGMIEL